MLVRAALSLVLAAACGFLFAPACGRDSCAAISAITMGSYSPGVAADMLDGCVAILQPTVCCVNGTAQPIDAATACGALLRDGSFTDCEVDACASQDPCAPADGTCAGLNAVLTISAFATCTCPDPNSSYSEEDDACSCNPGYKWCSDDLADLSCCAK